MKDIEISCNYCVIFITTDLFKNDNIVNHAVAMVEAESMLWKQLEFRYPENIIFMLIPFLLLLILILGYRKKEKILAALHLKTGRGSGFLVIFLLTLASVLLAISAMGPQIFTGYQEVQKEGLDIYILLDTSKSMLVEGICRPPGCSG